MRNKNTVEFMSKTEHLRLEGSEHVKQFKLQERFHMDVHMTFKWNRIEDGSGPSAEQASSSGRSEMSGKYNISATSAIQVEVDIPPPFSIMPKSVLSSAGNAGVQATNKLIVNSFVDSLAKDYARWANEQIANSAASCEAQEKELQELRAAATAVLGTYEEAMRSLA